VKTEEQQQGGLFIGSFLSSHTSLSSYQQSYYGEAYLKNYAYHWVG